MQNTLIRLLFFNRTQVNSYIHEDHDIPVKFSHGDKLINKLSIIGEYNENGDFVGFKSELQTKIGKTFKIVPGEQPTGYKRSIYQRKDGSWHGGFDITTRVNDIEKPGLKLLGEVVDVNQNVNYEIDTKCNFKLNIKHGTFPSVNVFLNSSYRIYGFRQHSYSDSHGGVYELYSFGEIVKARTKSLNENKKLEKERFPFVEFKGYSVDTEYLKYHEHYPNSPKK